MGNNSEMIHADGQPGAAPVPDAELKLAQLYLSTCEILAGYAYEATATQQQLNILAQQMTVAHVKTLYSILS